MVQTFSRLAAFLRKQFRKPRPAPTPRTSRPGLETLEGRALPSATMLGSLVNQPPTVVHTATLTTTNPITIVHNPIFFSPVPNLQGLDFHLISSNGKPAHDLVIQTETWNVLGNASFTGNWIGDKNNGVNPISNGWISHGANGTSNVSFSWNGDHYFTGTLTWVPPSLNRFEYLQGHWHLDGNVTVPGNPNGGPGHVSGDAYLPILRLP